MKVLIIGTSHTEASCRRHKDDNHVERMMQGRYHDYFKTEFGWETTVIAQGGVTPQAQLYAVTAYFADHPDEKWDLCLFEGRNIETTVMIPHGNDLTKPSPPTWDEMYHRFVDKDYYHKDYEYPFYCLTIGTEKFDNGGVFHQYTHWADNYVLTPNQMLDFFGCNRAIISLVEERCPIVKFWVFSHPFEVLRNDPDYQFIKPFGEQILGKYFLFDDPWKNVDVPMDMRCTCNHPNEQGHKWMWDNVIKPATLKIIDNN